MIYKYIDCDFKKLATAKRNQLWMSSPEDFNDPFDCNLPIRDNFSAEDFEAIMRLGSQRLGVDPPDRSVFLSATEDEKRQFIQNSNEQFRLMITSFGVCCFSKVWDSILMWSHYADRHQGICLGYDETEFMKQHPEVLNKVRYCTHYPDVELTEIPRDFNGMLKKYLLTKYVDWRYEQEWRLIIIEDACRKRVSSPFPIKEIIVGVKIDPEIKKVLCDCADSSISLFEAIHEPTGEYGLLRRQLDNEAHASDK